MKRLYSSPVTVALTMVFLFATVLEVQAQTDPTPQTLPYSQNFSGLPHTSSTYPAGWQGVFFQNTGGVNGAGGAYLTGPHLANANLIGNSTASGNAGGVHNYNAKIGLLGSANNTSGNPALVLAINTTGQADIEVSWDAGWVRGQGRSNAVGLQYRIGTSGDFTNVPGSEYVSPSGLSVTAGTLLQDVQSRTVSLPAVANNQPVVQLRWAIRDVAGSGSRTSLAITNVSVTSGGGPDPDPDPVVAFGEDSGTVVEGNTIDIPVTMANYVAPVTVQVALTSGDASWFSNSFPESLTFTGNGYQDILSEVIDDGVYTGPRTATFTLSVTNGTADLGQSTYVLTIEDSSPPPPLSIAAARAAGVGATVTVEGVVSRARGAFTYFQDDTAGLSIRQVSGGFFDAVADGDITTGTRISVTGTLSVFNDLLQINQGDLDAFQILEQDVTLVPQVITLADLQDDSHQAQLVTVHGLDFVTPTSGNWANATSYNVTDGTETREFRVPNAADNTIGGTPIPAGTFSFTGAVGHFNVPQLMAVLVTDVYEDATEVVEVSVGSEDEGEGWRMLSSPVIGATVADLAAVNLVYGIPGEYPGTDDTNILTGYDGTDFVAPASVNAPLVPGKGFIWYLWGTDLEPGMTPPGASGGSSSHQGLPVTIEYTGVSPVFENYSVTFTAEEHPAAAGWYLIGNPYGKAYDLRGVTVSSGSASGTFHHWDPTDGPLGAYDVYDAVDTDPVTVAPGLGFFIEVGGEVALPLEITFGAPSTAIREVTERFAAQFELTGDLFVELGDVTHALPVGDRNARMVFSQDATDDFDLLDAGKLTPLSAYWATIALVGLNNGEQVLRSSESRPLPTAAVTIPMALSTFLGEGNKLEASGTLTITLAENTLGAGWQVVLTDLETGATANLLTDNYTFNVDTQPAIDADQRFEITFTPPTVSGEGDGEALAFGLEAVWPNPTATSTQVAFHLEDAGEISLDVYDVLGRRVVQVATGEYAAGRHVLPLSTNDLASGVYIVRLTSGSNVAVQRVTVAR